MKNSTKLKYLAFVSHVALLSGFEVQAGAETATFSVEPTIQQNLYDLMSEEVSFLNKINKEIVDEIKGEKLGLSVSGPVMSRTNTTGSAERTTTDPSNLKPFQYECVKCDFDTHLLWSKLDQWAKFPDFQTRISKHLARAYGQDLMRVGFHGVTAAPTTNKTTNPNLEDVGKGWLQNIREDKPEAVMDGVPAIDGKPATPDDVYFGTHADNYYKNLDAIVKDAVNNLIPTWNRDAGLIAIVGAQLLDDKYFNVINQNHVPTEANAAEVLMATKRLGGLQAMVVPFFPQDKILITTLDNLSIYEQDSSRRRSLLSNPKKNCEEDFQSSNIAWVVEDYDLCALIENISERNA